MGRPNIIISNESIRTGKISDDAGSIADIICTISVVVNVTPETLLGAADGTASAVVSGNQGILTFSWAGPNGFTSSDQNIINLEVGSYTVTVLDAIAIGCAAIGIGVIDAGASGVLFAADFNGLNFLSSSSANYAFGNTDFSLLVWYFPSVAETKWVITKTGGAGNFGYGLQARSDGAIRGLISHDGIIFTTLGTAAGLLNLNDWNLVVFVHDSVNDLMKLSVNNSTYATIAHSLGLFATSANFQLSGFDGANSPFIGRGDSLMVYNKAVTQVELTAIYNSGAGVDFPSLNQVSLVSYHKLNELTGPRIDFHGSNDLTDNSSVGRAVGHILD